jgi:hypothetical protein
MDLTISLPSTSGNTFPVQRDLKAGSNHAQRVEQLTGQFAPPGRRKISFDNVVRSA